MHKGIIPEDAKRKSFELRASWTIPCWPGCTMTLAKPFRAFLGKLLLGAACSRAGLGATKSCTTSAASMSPAVMSHTLSQFIQLNSMACRCISCQRTCPLCKQNRLLCLHGTRHLSGSLCSRFKPVCCPCTGPPQHKKAGAGRTTINGHRIQYTPQDHHACIWCALLPRDL